MALVYFGLLRWSWFILNSRIGPVDDGLGEVDPVRHVGDAAEGVDQGAVRAAHGPAIGVPATETRQELKTFFLILFKLY
jgi:hypothetical protein